MKREIETRRLSERMIDAMIRLDVSARAHSLVWLLLLETLGRGRETFETSLPELEERLVSSRSTVRRALRELQEAGAIDATGVSPGRGRRFVLGFRPDPLRWKCRRRCGGDSLSSSPVPSSPGVLFLNGISPEQTETFPTKRNGLERRDLRVIDGGKGVNSDTISRAPKRVNSDTISESSSTYPHGYQHSSPELEELRTLLDSHPRFDGRRHTPRILRGVRDSDSLPYALEWIVPAVRSILEINIKAGRATDIQKPVGWMIGALRRHRINEIETELDDGEKRKRSAIAHRAAERQAER